MIKPKKKLTYNQIMGILNQMASTITQIETMINHYGKVLDDYILFKEDKDAYIAYLEEKYPKEGEEDATEDKEGQTEEEIQEEDNKEIDDKDNKKSEDK